MATADRRAFLRAVVEVDDSSTRDRLKAAEFARSARRARAAGAAARPARELRAEEIVEERAQDARKQMRRENVSMAAEPAEGSRRSMTRPRPKRSRRPR